MRFSWLGGVLAVGMALPGAAFAKGPTQLHLSIAGASRGSGSVEISIPFDDADDAISSKDGGNFKIDASSDDTKILREMWDETRRSGRAQERVDKDKTLRTDLKDGRATIEVKDAGKTSGVSIELSEKSMDALLGADGDRIDIGAALKKLGRKGGGMTIRGEDGSTIRLWAE
jgi:hypothetical protein